MTQSEAIKVFEQRNIRSLWDEELGARALMALLGLKHRLTEKGRGLLKK